MSIFALWVSTLLAFGVSVTEVTITPMASQTSVLIAMDGEVSYRDFTLEAPHRLVLDLMGAQHELSADDFAAVNRGGIVSMRTSQYSDDVVRIVLDLDRELGYSVIPDQRGMRISLENPMGDFEPWSSARIARPFDPAEIVFAPQSSQVQEARRISATWVEAPVNDVLLAFAAFSGKSVVPSSNVTGFVTADINDQPWDIALRYILQGQGLKAEESSEGIIRVDKISDLKDREGIEQILTHRHRISHGTADETNAAVTAFLRERGSSTGSTATNTLVVSDIARVQDAIAGLLGQFDIETRQVSVVVIEVTGAANQAGTDSVKVTIIR
jgi:hypothetical protein